MKKCLVCFVLACLLMQLGTCALAAQMEDDAISVLAAIDEIATWNSDILDSVTKDDDAVNVAFIISDRLVYYELLAIQETATATEDTVTSAILNNDYTTLMPSPDLNDCDRFSTDWHYIELIDATLRGNFYIKPDFMQIDTWCINASGDLVGMQRMQLAKRDDEILVALMDYNEDFSATTRFALHITQDEVRSIETGTFGITMEMVLDPHAWQMGESLGEWDKTLLYPKTME